jgi:hypothetical protein
VLLFMLAVEEVVETQGHIQQEELAVEEMEL